MAKKGSASLIGYLIILGIIAWLFESVGWGWFWALFGLIGVLFVLKAVKKEAPKEQFEDYEIRQEGNHYILKSKYSNDEYFSLLGQVQDWQAKKQYTKMLDCCKKSLPLLKKFVENQKKQFGSFDISSIPAIEIGCRYWAALNDDESLNSVKDTITEIPELNEGWSEFVAASFEDSQLSRKIKEFIKENPGFRQNKIGKALGVSGHDTARVINTLNNLGIIRRNYLEKTYELFIDTKRTNT